jgi:DNA-binding SARP family transcriptional activator
VAAAATLRIGVLGGFRVMADGRPSARTPTARQQQLITFLLLQARHGAVPRQRLAGSLWPESTDVQALTNLRRELHHLRESWPQLDALIESGTRTVAWRGGSRVAIDLVAFETAAERGLDGDRVALQEAAALYEGDLLPDCAEEWIAADRERLRQRAREVLTQLVTRLEQERAFGDAIDAAQRLLRIDRLDEQAWCALMRCHARRGERATALHVYQQCAAALKAELGVQPSAATRLTYREILDLDVAAPATPAPPAMAVYPLVGRHSEWQVLLNAWRVAASGATRLFVVRGEAGIGKTRLAEELIDWCGLNGVTALTARCYAGQGNLAYAPIAAWLRDEALRPVLMRLDPSTMSDVVRLRPEMLAARSDVPPPSPQLESWQRLPFFDALAQPFRSASPIVLVIDDLQWADADTVEWLQYFIRSGAATPCLVVATVRAEEEADNAPLEVLLRQLERDRLVTAIVLGPLDRTATAQLAGEVVGHQLDETAVARTFRETEGHPLFIIERGRMDAASHNGGSSDEPLPEVQAVVAARLALLSDDARAAAEVAAAVGRDFRFDILAQASDLEEDALVRAVDELWRRHIVRVQADERWDFSHDRIREVTYGGIGPARRRLIHRRIAQGMELLGADRLDDVSASIAMHLERGGQPTRAIPFLERAAAVATRVSATEEAIRCLTHALTLLDTVSADRERDQKELALRSRLSIALNSGRGYAATEVEQNRDRIFVLTRSNGRGEIPVRWLWAAFTMRYMLGDMPATRAIAEQALAQSIADPSCRCEAHHAMGGTLVSVGEPEESRRHFDAALAAYDEQNPQHSAFGSDLGVFAHAWFSHALWLLGDETAALAHIDQAVDLARRRDHKYTLTLALAYASLLHQMRLDTEGVIECADGVIALCDRYGFAYYGDWARLLRGWTYGRSRPAEGIDMIESALERLDRHRAQARRPYYLSLLADTYVRDGRKDRASTILDAARTMALERGDVWWLPALYLQKSELQPPADRSAMLKVALELARAQGSAGLERRILAASNLSPA